jgi:hypothetical protein
MRVILTVDVGRRTVFKAKMKRVEVEKEAETLSKAFGSGGTIFRPLQHPPTPLAFDWFPPIEWLSVSKTTSEKRLPQRFQGMVRDGGYNRFSHLQLSCLKHIVCLVFCVWLVQHSACLRCNRKHLMTRLHFPSL